MPELAWHKKIVTLWCDHEMLEDAMTWLEHEHGDGTLVTIKHLGMEKRRNLYGIRVHEDTAPANAAGKETGRRQADHSERMDGALEREGGRGQKRCCVAADYRYRDRR